MMTSEIETGLAGLLSRGGIYYALPGNSVREIMTNLIKEIPIPKTVMPEALLNAVLEREALMSTGIGQGIALPHPRNPIIAAPEESFMAMAFLEHPVDWKALDGSRVDVILLIVSVSPQFHLRTLSEVTFFCQQDEFLKILGERASKETIIRYIKETEHNWK